MNGLQVFAISVWRLPSNSGNVSSPLATQVQSVSNSAASSGPQASRAGGSARAARSRVRELQGPLMGESRYLYIGKSLLHRSEFDTKALGRSRPGDSTQKNAQIKIALLEEKLDKRKSDLRQAVNNAACDNGKRKSEILDVNAERLSQAQALKDKLGDPMSEQLGLNGLINQYESFSVGITNRSSRTPGTSTPAVTPK